MNVVSLSHGDSTIAALLQQAMCMLRQTLEQPATEARRLLAFVLEWPVTRLLAYDQTIVARDEVRRFLELVDTRASGIPLAHLVGAEGFWSLTLHVTPACLIPRPETELLVELALASPETALRVADLGTGSGAVALALATERPDWHITATDRSAQALAVAQGNAQRLGLTQLQWRLGDWCEPLLHDPPYDLLISNPPYLAHGEPPPDHEPPMALYAGPSGTEALEAIIWQSQQVLTPGGRLLLEHGASQRPWLLACLDAAGFRVNQVCDDGAGLPRAVMAQRH
jgi:release factor glutamine methyltransferase